MSQKNCFCGSEQQFENCCDLYISGKAKPKTAETLMRSRYSAYVTSSIDYLIETTASSEKKFYSKNEILKWSKENHWVRLEVINSTENTVEFKAYYLDYKLQPQIHHEKSTFIQENGEWRYLNGIFNEEIG